MSEDATKLIYYSILSESVPRSLKLGPDVEELLKVNIKTRSFSNELEVIEEYTKLKREPTFNPNDIGTTRYSESDKNIESNPQKFRDDEIMDRNMKIDSMMKMTSLERDVAEFYLESSMWDLHSAMKFFQDLN